MTRIVVHVGQLVLRGFEQGDRHRIAADLQGELGRLLADPEAARRLASLSHVPGIRVGRDNAAAGGKAERPGISAAMAVARGLSR
jgi:hypothetical protein